MEERGGGQGLLYMRDVASAVCAYVCASTFSPQCLKTKTGSGLWCVFFRRVVWWGFDFMCGFVACFRPDFWYLGHKNPMRFNPGSHSLTTCLPPFHSLTPYAPRILPPSGSNIRKEPRPSSVLKRIKKTRAQHRTVSQPLDLSR